ncbi:hypothetical protein NMG60_11018760 [Bertholletia excelsa]
MEQKRNGNAITSSRSCDKEDRYKGEALVHSQVRKIRQEMEKIKHPSLQQPGMRPVLREITRQMQRQRSRSPLGLEEREIPVTLLSLANS